MDRTRFASRYPFPLDRFQLEGIDALEGGESVLVAAPTGSGKTVVAEFAVELALSRGRKAFYTTPLKALSNQKFGDFGERYGRERVGLLTGDNSVNGEAPVVVMTTEVLRNMLYEASPTLEGLDVVVMDEVHYLQDPYRGAVWEEILIHLPLSVAAVCLSATVSNAEEFGEWLATLRGTTRVVIEERRPVPLEHLTLVGRDLHPMHVEQDGRPIPNPYVVSLGQRELRGREYRRGGDGRTQVERIGRPREGHRRVYVPRREEVVERLAEEGMLPAIYFVFSRAGCDRSVEYLMSSGVRLTSREDEARIRATAEERVAWIDEVDLTTLGFYELREALAVGIAAHHAGMLPVFKELVENLFAEGLVQVVFATETLSLGINMPARTVVIEDLFKFSGERHELLTSGEYTQLTGRAGRRGIDELGYAVVLHQRNVDFERVAGLASTRTYELRSSFRPSYNMAVNLVRTYTPEEAHHLLNSSFAQFQADRGVVALERQLERDRAFVDGYRDRVECHLGDFWEYWSLREKAEDTRRSASRDVDRRRLEEVRGALEALRPGDVVFVPRASRRGLAAVVGNREGRPTLLMQDRRFFRAAAKDFPDPPVPVTRIPLPRGNPRSARYRRDVASALVGLDVRPPKRRSPRVGREALARAEELDRRAEEHPCHGCPDRGEHERWAARASKLIRQVEGLERRIRARTETLARRFDRVLRVLERLGYVERFRLTPRGETLSRIYGEGDIVIAEALAEGLLDGLSAPEVAALVSTLVFESREREPRGRPELPTGPLRDRFAELGQIWRRVRKAEEDQAVELTRELDAGFAAAAFHWAEGKSLEDVLAEARMAPGDFVRTCKQLVDLLKQIEGVAEGAAASAAGSAHAAVRRGVVAYTGL